MGVPFNIVLYAPDRATANRGFAAVSRRVARLEAIFSDYDSQSEVGRLCRNSPARQGEKVSDDLWKVLCRSQSLSARTDGAFDVTVGPLTKLWRRARRRREMPSPERLAEARTPVGYKHVRLDCRHHTVQLLAPKMRLDFGGIAKGYAADEALSELARLGITRALVDASGDIAIGDPPPSKKGWKIGIAPLEPGAEPSRMLLLANCAVATSGDAFQYVEIDGRRYSHIVDPRTGLGLTTRSSVSIVASDCTTADSLASAVSVLGVKDGLELVEKTSGVSALITEVSEGKTRTHESCRMKQLPAVPLPE